MFEKKAPFITYYPQEFSKHSQATTMSKTYIHIHIYNNYIKLRENRAKFKMTIEISFKTKGQNNKQHSQQLLSTKNENIYNGVN